MTETLTTHAGRSLHRGNHYQQLLTSTTLTAPLTHQRSAILAMHVGWMLTVAALATAWIDRATANELAQHIRASYPHYSRAHIESAADTYVVYLTVVGAAGLIAWLTTIRALQHNKPWLRPGATLIFILAASLSLTNLLIKDTSGDTGLPPLLGWVGLLPCLSGLLAVVLLWNGRHDTLAYIPESPSPRVNQTGVPDRRQG